MLANGRRSRLARLLRRAYVDATVTVCNAGRSASGLHTGLAAAGRFDLIVDHQRKIPARRAFVSTFLHLEPGGAYLASGPAGSLSALRERLRALEQASHSKPDKAAGRRTKDDQSLGSAIGSVEAARGLVVVVNRTEALAKLRDPEIDRVLAKRPNAPDRIIKTIAGETFTSRCQITRSDGLRSPRTPETYDAPPVSLREYHGALCVPGQVVTQGNLLLPDTYRHNQSKRLNNLYTEDLSRRFAAVPQLDQREAEPLAGTYFYLDSEHRGHFGHAITEQVSRLWGWQVAKAAEPDLKALLLINKDRPLARWEIDLYGAAGVPADDIVFLEHPARVERLVAATPMFSMPHYVHPEISHTWDLVGDALAAKAPAWDYPDRIFVSRRLRKRACLNTLEVEALFAGQGFEVVFPEDYPLPEQVAMFRHAEVIAGFAGSGLFHVCFVEQPKLLIMLSHDSYTASNEYMMAAVRGHEIVAVVSQPDLERAGALKRPNDFQAPFTFDFNDEGRFLTKVLADL